MKISGSQIYSGQNIPAYKKNKSLYDNTKDSKTNESSIKADTAQNSAVIVNSFQEKQTTYKESIPYTNKRALSEYFILHNLDKREYAQQALGFSTYA